MQKKLSLFFLLPFLFAQTRTMQKTFSIRYGQIAIPPAQSTFQQLVNLLKEEYSPTIKLKIAASATGGALVGGTSTFVGLQELGIDAGENPKFYLVSTLIASIGGGLLAGRWAYRRSPNGLYAQAENKIRKTLDKDIVAFLNTTEIEELNKKINSHYLVTRPQREYVEDLETRHRDLRIAGRLLNLATSHSDCTNLIKGKGKLQDTFVKNCLERITKQMTTLRGISTYNTQLFEDINNNIASQQNSQTKQMTLTALREIGFPVLTQICLDIYRSGKLSDLVSRLR